MSRKSHSWRVLEDGAIIKYLDKSSFDSEASAIPQDLYANFGIEKFKNKSITIRWGDQITLLSLEWEQRKKASPLLRIYWRGTEFTPYLKKNIPFLGKSSAICKTNKDGDSFSTLFCK